MLPGIVFGEISKTLFCKSASGHLCKFATNAYGHLLHIEIRNSDSISTLLLGRCTRCSHQSGVEHFALGVRNVGLGQNIRDLILALGPLELNDPPFHLLPYKVVSVEIEPGFRISMYSRCP